MIRINLLKDSKPKKKGGLNLPANLIKKIGIGSGALASLLLIFVILKTFVFTGPKEEGVDYVVRDDFNPSSLLNKDAVEETVTDEKRHGDKIDKNGVLRLPYGDLTFIEKVNFENHFAKSVVDLLKRNVTTGVNFRGVNFDNFTELTGNGSSNSRSKIRDVFKSLRSDGVTFSPKPNTSIFKLKEGYGFKVESVFAPGLDSKSPFKIYAEDIPSYDDVDIIIKRIIDAAQEGGLRIKSGPTRNGAKVEKGYRRLTYRMSSIGSYRSFESFVNKMFLQQIPCSIKKASLKAISTGSLGINVEIIITTKR